MFGVPIDDDENSIIWLCVALPAAFWQAQYEVHRNIHPWAAWLRQRLYTFVRPMLHGAYALAGRTGPSVGLDLAQHARPVVYPGHELKGALCTKMPSDRVIVVAAEHLRSGPSGCRAVQLHPVIKEAVVLLPVTLVLTQHHGRNTMILGLMAAGEA